MSKPKSNDKTRRMVFVHEADKHQNAKVACFFSYDDLHKLGNLLDGTDSHIFEETDGNLEDPKNPYSEDYKEITDEITWVLKSIFDGTPSQKVDPDDYISSLEPNSEKPVAKLN